MKILLTSLQPDFDIQTERDGNPQWPWAIVEMKLGVAEATEVGRRIDGIHPVDRFIRAHVMLHG